MSRNSINDMIEVHLPSSLENLKLPDPALVTYYKNLQDRIVWVDYSIDENVLEVSRLIMRWNQDDRGIETERRKPIKLLIYSYGGDGQACFSLLDTISVSKTPVYTYNMGVAMSAGLLILLAGHKRFGLKHSVALIHSGSGGAQGTYEQVEAQTQDYKRFVKSMREYILERTDIDARVFSKHKDKEWYLYVEDQLKHGIINSIIEDIEELNPGPDVYPSFF